MRVLGIDFGERWFGFALSDPTARIARPLEVADGEAEALDRVAALVLQEGIDRIIVGLPRNMDGSLGPKAREALRFAERVRGRVPAAVETWDERLTTVQAERWLEAAEVPRRRFKERVNQVAAQIMLQSYLDARTVRDEPPPGEGRGCPDRAENSGSHGREAEL